jgi:hypothetical protein
LLSKDDQGKVREPFATDKIDFHELVKKSASIREIRGTAIEPLGCNSKTTTWVNYDEIIQHEFWTL